MFAGVRGSSALVALTVALFALPAAFACVTSGCDSSAPVGLVDASTDALTFSTVVTTGGGIPAADAGRIDPFASSSSSGGVADGGSSGGSDGASNADTGASSGEGGSDGSAVDDAQFSDAPYDAPTCNGTDPCDLRSNTCCLANGMSGLVGTCVPGRTTSCCPPTGNCTQATVHCSQASDCPVGLSCCGDIIVLLGQVEARCVSVPQGATCPYVPWTNSQIGVQLCKTDAECTNGQPCIHQTCLYGAQLSMCGIQSDMPLNCAASP